MTNWQKEMINYITTTHKDFDNAYALRLAREWSKTDEKYTFVLDTFAMSAWDARADYWVDRIEDQFIKVLEANEMTLSENAESWLWLCNQ